MLANFRQSRLLTFVSYCLQSASIVLCYLPDFWSHWFVIPGGPVGKESTCSAGDWVSIPESGRSPGEGNGKPLQYFCLENPMDRGAWWAIVHGILRVGHDLAIKPQQFFSVISNLELSLVPLRLMILLWLLIQSHLTLRDPVDCLTPGFPVVHHLPELVQTHVHWVSDAIQPSHPVVLYSSCLQSFPVLGSFLVSQLFIWGGQSIGVSASASVLPINPQGWSPLGWTGWLSLQFKGLSRVLSNTTVQKHQFFSIQPSLRSNSHIYTWLNFWLLETNDLIVVIFIIFVFIYLLIYNSLGAIVFVSSNEDFNQPMSGFSLSLLQTF